MSINYQTTNYQASPSTATPLNPTNLNHSETGIKAACDGVDAINADLSAVEITTQCTLTPVASPLKVFKKGKEIIVCGNTNQLTKAVGQSTTLVILPAGMTILGQNISVCPVDTTGGLTSVTDYVTVLAYSNAVSLINTNAISNKYIYVTLHFFIA